MFCIETEFLVLRTMRQTERKPVDATMNEKHFRLILELFKDLALFSGTLDLLRRSKCGRKAALPQFMRSGSLRVTDKRLIPYN